LVEAPTDTVSRRSKRAALGCENALNPVRGFVRHPLEMKDKPLPEDLVAFCQEQHPRLVGALSLYCGDADVAEELAQEAIAYAIRDWKRIKQKSSPPAWLYRVGLNLAHSHYRRRATERRARERLQASTAPSLVDDVEVGASIREAVSRLHRRQRQALVLRYFLDLSVAQTADLMECSEGTVKSLTHQAIKSLRRSDVLADLVEVSDVR
jgi:RNA polymerase sigma factor (sigma-70 family)